MVAEDDCALGALYDAFGSVAYRGLTVGQIIAHLGEPESGTRELLRTAMLQLPLALSSGRYSRGSLVSHV